MQEKEKIKTAIQHLFPRLDFKKRLSLQISSLEMTELFLTIENHYSMRIQEHEFLTFKELSPNDLIDLVEKKMK